MKARILLLSSLMLLCTAAFAQTTYSVVPTQCGVATNPMQCTLDLSPANSLGIYPTLQLTDDLVNDTGGLVDWSTTQGPTGQYLGAGVIEQSCSGGICAYESYPLWAQFCSNGACLTAVSTLTVYFDGSYIGGGRYAGFYTLHMTYKRSYNYRTGWRWIRTVTGGAVRISE